MPKRAIISTTLTALALALLLSFKTPSSTTFANTNSNNGSNTGSNNGSGGNVAVTNPPGNAKTFTGTLTGDPVQIPFGVVQVQVTMANGQITDVQTLQAPNDNPHSNSISNYATPQLRSEVLQAQSANVNTIGGATYTSEGYLQSLQSALDKA
jgi:uncharacterized protein with FMN-binding domain